MHAYDPYDDETTPQPPLHLHKVPKGHGPAVTLPKFVRAQGSYDELGRSTSDGFGVDVGTGKRREVDKGAFDFWKGLELGSGGTSTVAAGPSSSNDATRAIPPSTTVPARNRVGSEQKTTPALAIPRSEWFIRRALAAKARKAAEEADHSVDQEDTDGHDIAQLIEPSLASAPIPQPSTSLASMLSLPPPGQAKYEAPTHFHIKPNNKGWKLLERSGWSGKGGLGRPEGWEEHLQVKKEDMETVKQEEGLEGIVSGSKEEHAIDLDAVIDLTDMDDESNAIEHEVEVAVAGPTRFGEQQLHQAEIEAHQARAPLIGPGRVAPVATYLKHDLSGIGHKPPHRAYSSLRPNDPAAKPKTLKKKVTHTVADMRAAQRGKIVAGLSEEDLEMKRRGWAKKDAKRDRDDRKKWMQILSA
jgi:hypothetical protein